tara:strand:+ start:330 stop:1265 length:936 start_codon:yes stop_codon:yes gene_type:complete
MLPNQLAFCLLIVGLGLYFIRLVRPLLVPSGDHRVALTKRTSYYCFPAFTVLIILFEASLGLVAPPESPIPAGLPQESPALAAFLISPLIGFSLLTVSEFLSWFFVSVLGPASKFAHLRQPVLAVHATTALYYIICYTRGTAVMEDRFGRPFYPVRSVMWTVSVSSLGLAVNMLLEEMPGSPKAKLHDALVHYLIAVPACFVTGFLASWQRSFWPAMMWLALSFVAFWYMLGLMVWMLRVGETHPMIRRGGNAPQFRVLQVVILVVWHIFPAIWVFAAAGWITPLVEHACYVGNDLIAKYLILFVTIASMG